MTLEIGFGIKKMNDIKLIEPTVKNSIEVMVWRCFCNNKLGPLVLVEGILNSEKYIELLQEYFHF